MPDGARRDRKGRFLNPDGSAAGQKLRLVWKMLREGNGAAWPAWVAEPPPPPLPEPAPGEVAVTFIGHSCFLLRCHGGPTLLTDPVWSARASPLPFFGPQRVRAPALAFDALPRIDAVLLSHNHYDHLDLPTLRRLRARDRPLIVSGLGVGAWLARKGLPGAVQLDWWQDAALPHGLAATYLPAQHFSARGLGDRGHTLWGGFALLLPGGGRIAFLGDTGWGAHLAEIGARAGPFDLALIPIGAYAPRWFMAAVHMDPDEALAAYDSLRARLALAMHFGTFKLTQEAIDEPARRLLAAKRPDQDFRIPGFGETLLLRLPAA